LFKAIVFKEWLKIRWTLFIIFLLSIVILVNIWINLTYGLRFSGPSDFWGLVIFRKYVFFSLMQYFPLLAGLSLAIAQFLPEMHRDRLKLTLRLPLPENRIIFQMNLVAFATLILLYLFDLIFLLFFSSLYFPSEILINIITIVLPWHLAGISCYFAVSTILVEPAWFRRLILLLVMYGFLQIYFQPPGIYSYYNVIPFLVPLSLLPALGIYYAVHHYQKGTA
jgi:hypothetical protein